MASITRRDAALALASSCVTSMAFAGSGHLPSDNQRLIVPFAAGGTADGLGRVVAEILNDALGTRFTVENRPGRNGSVGAELAARAPPDGRTLLLGTLGTAVTNHLFDQHLDYDGEGSFTPVALVAEMANVLVVHPALPATTLATFVTHAKRRGAESMACASPGTGSTGHLFMEYFQRQAGIRLSHAAYGGRSRMIRNLLAGRALVAMDNLPACLPHIRSGALRALGVTSARRCECAPQIASIAEQGYPEYAATLWWYVAAPAGTRLALVNTLSDEIVKGVAAEPAIASIRAWSASELPAKGDELANHIAGERAKWRRVIEATRLQPT